MSEATAKADAFVSAHLDQATTLGRRLADLTGEPEAYLATLIEGLEALSDPDYLAMVTRACPQTPARYAVRGPLSTALMKPVRSALREGSSIIALQLAQRLIDTDRPGPAPLRSGAAAACSARRPRDELAADAPARPPGGGLDRGRQPG